MPGLFISCEGGEGSGKTTLMHGLEQALRKDNAVIHTREPGGTELGEHIRQWLLNKEFTFPRSAKAELLLFLASRAQHIDELIKPALEQGKIVLCDRFNDSTIAYQGLGRGLGMEYVQELCKLVCQNVIPDVTFFLDLDPQLGLKRSSKIQKKEAKAGDVDRFESERLEFHQRVREGMRRLAKQNPERIITLDATKPIEEVLQAAVQHVRQKVTKAKGTKGT